jgi:hypothetical protein
MARDSQRTACWACWMRDGDLHAGVGDAPSAFAIRDIPASLLRIYEQVGAQFKVPSEVLAGIGQEECDQGGLAALVLIRDNSLVSRSTGTPSTSAPTTARGLRPMRMEAIALAPVTGSRLVRPAAQKRSPGRD